MQEEVIGSTSRDAEKVESVRIVAGLDVEKRGGLFQDDFQSLDSGARMDGAVLLLSTERSRSLSAVRKILS